MEAPDPAPAAGWRQRLPGWLSSPSQVAAAVGGTAAAVAVAALVLRPGAGPPPQLALPRAEPAAGAAQPDGGGATPGALRTVHVAGAVLHPGLYTLRAGARVADAVAAAGGALPDAALERLNLAAPVADGERLWVPRAGETEPPPAPGPGGGAGAAGGAAAGPVDLNRATVAELDTLPGVGPATARAIVAHRDRNGPFRSVSELLRVPGIGPAKLEALRPLVRV